MTEEQKEIYIILLASGKEKEAEAYLQGLGEKKQPK